MSEQRNYRKFSAKKKAEIVIAGLRGDRSVRDVCREHGIAETLYYSWREKLLEGGQLALAGKDERAAEKELRKKIAELERAPGSQDLRARDSGGSIAGLGVSERVARSRVLVARGYAAAAVARVMQITRQAIYRTPKPRRSPQRRPPQGAVEQAIVETANENPTDGYRMVWALVRRKLGQAIKRKRVLRVMREQGLVQRRREPRRRRPGFFRVERPDQLWQLDMTSVWVAEHGWCYLMAAIDCCTREITGWHLELRCRAAESIAHVERAARAQGIAPGQLVLGTDG